MANSNIRFQIGFDVKKDDLKSLSSALDDIQKKVQQTGSSNKIDDQLKEAGVAAKQLQEILNKSWNNKLGQLDISKLNNGIKETWGSVSKLKGELEKAGSTGSIAFGKMANSALNTRLQVKQTNESLEKMFKSIKNVFTYNISASLFNTLTGTIQQAYNYSVKLDTSLNDIRIVTGNSADQMERFAKQANAASKALSASTLDYTNASLIYYQQGLAEEDVAARAKTTIKAANVTGQTGAEVSEQLTAVWNGYKVTAEETEAYVDKLAAVAATTAADLEELSVGMSKVASAANAMGVDFDDLNAQIATIVSVTRQAPESVGTALKTIYARLGDLKVDGVDEFGISLGEVSSQLAQMGIQVLDQQGNLRDLTPVISEVAEKWSGWTEAQRQAAAVAMAGKRQYNNLIALFDNWDMYTDALNTSTDALGTLQEQQDIYMDSTKAHLQQLSTEAERTYDILFDQDTVNGFVDVFSGLIGEFNDFIEGIGGGTNAIVYFGSVVANVFNKQIGQEIKRQIDNFNVLKNNLASIRGQKNFNEEVRKSATEDVKRDYQAKGIKNETGVYDSAIQKQAEMRAEMLRLADQLSEADKQNLLEMQEQVGLLERQIAELKNSDYKEVLDRVFEGKGGSEVDLDEIDKWNKSKEKELTNLKERYTELFKIQNQGLSITKEEKQAIKEGVLSEEQRNAISRIRDQINRQHLSAEEKNKKFQEEINKLIQKQKDEIKKIKEEYEDVNRAAEERIAIEDGMIENYQDQSNAIQDKVKETLEPAEKIQRISNAIEKLTGGIQIASSVIGALKVGMDETATGAEKANAAFAGISGALSGAFNMLVPGSGFLVQGVLELIKGGLELTGIWDNIEDLFKSADEKLQELNESMRQFANTSQEYYSSTRQLEEIADEYKELSEKAGEYDSTINNLTSTERDRYNELKNIILKYNEDALLGYNDRGEAILKENENLEETIKLLKERYEEERKAQYSDEAIDKVTDTIKTKQKESKQNKKDATSAANIDLQPRIDLISANLTEESQFSGNENFVNRVGEINSQLSKGVELTKEEQDQIKKEFDLLINDNELKQYSKQLKQYKEQVIELFGELDGANDEIAKANSEIEKSSKASEYTSILLGITKYSDNYSSGYTELAKIAEENGIEDIETYIVNYINGLKIGDNPEDVYKLIDEFNQKLAKAFEENPDLVKSVQAAGEESKSKDFSSYQNRIEQQITDANNWLKDNKDALAGVDDSVKKAWLEEAFDFTNVTFDDNGEVKGVDTALTKPIDNLKSKIEEVFETTEVNRFDLTKIIGGDASETDINFIVENLEKAKESTNSWEEAVALVNEQLRISKELSEANANVDFLNGGIFDTLAEGKELSKEEVTSLEKLEEKYIELGEAYEVAGRNSREYIETLRAVQEAEEEAQQSLLKEELNNNIDNYASALDKYNNSTELNITANMDEVTEAIDNVFDKKYELEISVTEDILTDIDNVVKEAENAATAVSKIGQGFKVAANDAQAVLGIFPELAAEATVMADGTIQLANEATSAVLSGYGAQIDADKNKTAQVIHGRIEELKAEKAKCEAALEVAEDESTTKDELIKITEEYATTANDEIATSDKATTDAAITNSGVMAQAIIDNWAACAVAAKEYGAQAAQAAMGIEPSGVITGGKVVTTGNTVDPEKSKNSKDEKEALKKLRETTIKGLKKQIESYDKQIADLTIGESQMLSSVSGIEDAAKSGLANKDKSSGGGGGKGKQEKELKKLEDEFDRYWQLKKAIEAVDQALEKLDKREQHTYGWELINVLKQENELLEKQKACYEQLAQAQEAEAAELRGQLGTMGVMFDASGAIINYAEATAQALAAYNEAIQKYNAGLIDETTLGVAEKSFENFKKLLERYDTLYYTEMKETQDKLEEIRTKQIENNLKAWETELKIKIDWNDLKKGWNTFKKEMEEDFRKVFKDLRVDSKLNKKNAKYDKKNLNADFQAIKDVTAEIDKIMAGQGSDMFQSLSEAQEKLKELNEQMQQHAEDLKDEYKQAWDNYLDGIDQVADKLEIIKDRFDDINDELEYQRQLIELLYGEDDYRMMSEYYEAQHKTIINAIDSYQTQVDFWKNRFEESGADINRPEDWTEDQKKYYDNWQSAQKQVNELALQGAKQAKEAWTNSIKQIIEEEQKMRFGGKYMDEAKLQWERLKEDSDNYYDSVEAVYQLQSLANKYNQSISETKDLKNQKALNELKEKELAMLEKKKKLSEFDMQAANLRYEIALKQMALEDAQNSKTDMKLTRNAEGNWAYQYVADEDNVTSKQQDLLDAWNSLYQLADEAYKNNMDTLFEIEETYAEKSLEYAEMMNSKNEEIAAKGQRLMDELREWYAKRTQDIADDNASIREQQATATAGVVKSTYENGSDGILDKAESVTEKEKKLAEDLKDTYMLDYDKMRDKANDTCEETREDWNSTAQTAINRFYSDPDSVKNSVTAAYNAIVGANTTYQNKLKELQDKAKQNWDQITTNINNAASATDNLAIKTKDYCDQGETDLDKLKKYVDKLKDAWESVTQAIKDAISTIELYLQKRQEAAAAENSSTGGIGAGGGTDTANTSGNNSSGGDDTGSGPSSNPDKTPTTTQKKHGVYNSAPGAGNATVYWTDSKDDADRYAEYANKKGKTNNFKSFKSGGYTGEWGEDGRLAMLHQKELVLNKEDTENFLSGINTIRDLASVNGSIEKSIMQAVINTATQLGNIKAGSTINGTTGSNSEAANNTFNITAEFPNANSVEEIRAAILSLPNYASQVMNSNLR